MAWFFFPRLISAFISILVLMVLSRVLGPADFGRYNITILFGTVSYSIVFAWLAVAIVRFHSSKDYDGKVIAYALHASIRVALYAIPFVALGYFFAPAHVTTSIVLGAVFCVAHTTQELGLAAFRVYRNGPGYAFVTLVRPLFAVALSVLFVLLGYGFEGAVLGAIIGALLSGSIALARVLPRSGIEPADFQKVKSLFIFGMPLGIVTSGSMVIVLLSQSMIATFADLGAVGIFAAAQTLAMRSIAMPMVMVSRASGATIFSSVETSGMEAANVALRRHFSYLLLLSAPVATTLIFANETAALIMFGEVYKDDVSDHLPLLALAAFMTGLQGGYFAYAFTLTKKTYTQLYILLAIVVAHAGITAIFLKTFGSIGASFAILLSAVLSCLAYYFIGKRSSTQVALPMAPIWKVLAASAAMAPFAAFADHQNSILAGLALIGLGTALFFGALIVLKQTGMMVVVDKFQKRILKRKARTSL